MASFSSTDSPYQHVPSTPCCFYQCQWKSPEAEVPQFQTEGEDVTSDNRVPTTPHITFSFTTERNSTKKSPDIALGLKRLVHCLSPQTSEISSVSPMNCLLEQVVPGLKDDVCHKRLRNNGNRLCKFSKRQILQRSRLKKFPSRSVSGISPVSEKLSNNIKCFDLFGDENNEIFA